MTKRIGVAMLGATLMFGGSVAINSAAAAPSQTAVQKQQTGEAGDLSTRRRIRHHHRYVYRPTYRPYYYDRPSYYAPTPFFPFLGLGYGPWW
jgi:hypothetical protein